MNNINTDRNSRNQGGRSQSKHSDLTCHYCERQGHIAKFCRKRIYGNKKISTNESGLQKDTDSNRRQKNFNGRNVKFIDRSNRHRHSRDNDEDEQANEVSTSEGASTLAGIPCYFCHERESNVESECPNVNNTVDLNIKK